MFVLLGCIILSIEGYGQINLYKSFDKKTEVKLISPLDMLYNVPDRNDVSIIEYQSIFDANKLPLFCKIEHKLTKSSKVNLRMRLGSLDYVNKLEGKN